MRLLEDVLVIDFSQFLSGPSASLRLADMGARVIKIEKPATGDICRYLYVSDTRIENESTIFHAINRNKESYAADLKNEEDVRKIKELVRQADVVMHNFRPGVMKRLGLDYETVKNINPCIVYGEITGYGTKGPWKDLPGQDLLLQSVSGLTWLSNNNDTPPTPMGVAVVDIAAGTHLAQGILAALYQRTITNESALVQVSMLESILDFQFEVLTCFYNDGGQLPLRSSINNANPYIAAPYGIYKTADGFLALSMTHIVELGTLINCLELLHYINPKDWFDCRDEIKKEIAKCLVKKTTDEWLSVLRPRDIWCAKVLDYEMLMQEDGYRCLQMELEVQTTSGLTVKTTRCPFRVDGDILSSSKGAPSIGENTIAIDQQFGLT